jgi:hypothetical protein
MDFLLRKNTFHFILHLLHTSYYTDFSRPFMDSVHFLVGLGHTTVPGTLNKGGNFFNNLDNMGIKRRRILHRFQKYKLT